MSEQGSDVAGGSLFDDYRLGAAWDEMLSEPGVANISSHAGVPVLFVAVAP